MTTQQMEHYIITANNIDDIRASMAAGDQADEIAPNDETWGIIYQPGNQRGQMTRYANGRGAVCFGGDSQWGDWYGDKLVLDEDNPNGGKTAYDEDGEDISEEVNGDD